jgi:DNA-binding NarL/FixJ family response regulator
MLSVYLIEDDELTALHVQAAFARAGDLLCLGRAANLAAAHRELPRLRPQVVVTDIGLPDGEGTELIAALRDGRCSAPAWWPHVLAYSVHEDEHRVLRAIESGSDDYVLKNGRPEELIEAVRRIGRGETSISPAIARHVLARLREGRAAQPLEPLDDDLLRLVAQGFLVEEVAERLQLSAQAVARRVRRLYARLYWHGHGERAEADVPLGTPVTGAPSGWWPSMALR